MVKPTGIVRPVDTLGRIVIPKELRKTLDIESSDGLEIYTEDDHIILKKYKPDCAFCSGTSDIIVFKDKNICKNCINEIAAMNRPDTV